MHAKQKACNNKLYWKEKSQTLSCVFQEAKHRIKGGKGSVFSAMNWDFLPVVAACQNNFEVRLREDEKAENR